MSPFRWLLSVGQRYKVWKQFTTDTSCLLKAWQLLSVGQRYKVWKQFTTRPSIVKH